MTLLVNVELPRTLDSVTARLLAERPAGLTEVWLFEDSAARAAAQSRLAAAGVQVRLRSAYKPLVHFFLEEVDLAALSRIDITYPVHPAADPQRFLTEAYPLAGLVGDAALQFRPGIDDLTYHVTLTHADGSRSDHRILAPNVVEPVGVKPNVVEVGHCGAPVLRCCGWQREGADAGSHLTTDFEALFLAAVAAVRSHDWGQDAPFFDRLMVRVDLPAADHILGYCSEIISFREAMHEDLFFSLRECLLPAPDAAGRSNHARPGQVVPDIRAGDAPRLVMTLEAFDAATETTGPDQPLATAHRPLTIGQIRRELATIEGVPIGATSREGRAVRGIYRAGPGPAVLITSGQHANETSGPVGALRAAQALARDPDAHFAIVPVENVDGYELHQRLIVENPFHMHHAARYTAVGDDLSSGQGVPAYERDARKQALALSGAKLHLNLHGYPSHEWTRPMSGYLPRGFEHWTIPKGFFLILVAHPGWEAIGQALLDAIVSGLAAECPALIAFNAEQLACVAVHMPAAPFEVRQGIPCIVDTNTYYDTPLTVITEATDETIYDALFRAAHDAQTRTVLLAVAAFRGLADRVETASMAV